MDFILPNMANCMIELAALLVLFMTLTNERLPLFRYAIVIVLAFGCSCLFTFVDSFLFSILPLNFTLIFLSFYIGFYSLGWKTVLWHLLISYLLIIYFQVICLCVIPTEVIATYTGYFLANGSILLCVVLFALLAKRFRFKEYYHKNQWAIRVFFMALCLPEFIIVQFLASKLATVAKEEVLFFLLVQLLYAALVLLVLVVITHKQERRRFADTEKHMETLNQALEESRQSIHDFNKHIRYLQSTVTVHLQNKQYTQLEEHLNAYCEEVLDRSEKDEAMLHLDDPVLRALLYRRRLQAKATGIEFCLDAPTALLPTFPLKNYQMVELFDNLVDNAFECVETMTMNRWVRVVLLCESLGNNRYRNMLCVQNPYDSINLAAILDDKPHTTKSGAHQGVGLKKVARLVDETGGAVVFNHDNRIFSVKILYED